MVTFRGVLLVLDVLAVARYDAALRPWETDQAAGTERAGTVPTDSSGSRARRDGIRPRS